MNLTEASTSALAAATTLASDSKDDETPTTSDPNPEFAFLNNEYEVLNKIGEGTFSTVYKAISKKPSPFIIEWYSKYMPELSSTNVKIDEEGHYTALVALKKIYATSSPDRILKELKLLHDLKMHRSVLPLVMAHRSKDQIVAVVPYFPHTEFKMFIMKFSCEDVAYYMRNLFTSLDYIHSKGITHRDVKPGNFLYNPQSKHGCLIDFGLSEVYPEQNNELSDVCACARGAMHRDAGSKLDIPGGYLKNDARPTRRANRAGTRGFRAPEVLFKCSSQSSKIDVWSAGICMLSLITRRFPFFIASDDVDALIETAQIFGKREMQKCAQYHGSVFECTIPTIPEKPIPLANLCRWSRGLESGNDKDELEMSPLISDAYDLLKNVLRVSSKERYSAKDALNHPFLNSLK